MNLTGNINRAAHMPELKQRAEFENHMPRALSSARSHIPTENF